MKAKAFDDLIRSEFDRGDFAYSPGNWDKLAKQLDKKPNKSKMFLWLPMAAIISFSSIAASLAMIISLPALVHHKAAPSVAAVRSTVPQRVVSVIAPIAASAPVLVPYNYTALTNARNTTVAVVAERSPFENLLLGTHNRQLLQNNINSDLHLAESIRKGLPAETTISGTPGFFAYSDHLYEPEMVEKKGARSSISLLGGINHGTQSSGYTVGFTARTMISEKMYVEGDVAFVNNSNAGKTEYTVNQLTPTAKLAATTKQLDISGGGDGSSSTQATVSKATSFGAYYAQFTPSVGYKVMKRFSVGMGADMQQLIQNAATATPDGSTDKAVPQFDLGVVGKTEYALSNRIKAGLYYRRGVTNVLLPTDNNRYIDRNYMQVQVKYDIFNK